MKLHRALFVIIFVAAAILRFVGTYPGYNQFHADEGISYSAATSMIKNGNLDPLRYDYPALVPIINNVFFRAVFIPAQWSLYYLKHIPQVFDGTIRLTPSALEARRLFQVEILGERERNALYWGRIVTALFSLANVILVYVLARKLFNKEIALIASFLLALNYKHVINSHIGLPDIYNAFFVLVVLLACLRLFRNPDRRNYLLAGICLGLSLAVKYQYFAVFPFALTHLAIWYKSGKLNLRYTLLSGLGAVLVFLLINPYHVLDLPKTLEIVRGVSEKYGMGTKELNLYPLWYFYAVDYGAVEFFLVIVGVVIAIRKYLFKSAFLLAHIVPFMFIMIYFSRGGFYIRNFITVTPIFLIFASVAIYQIYLFLRKRLPVFSKISLVGLLAAAVYIPGRNAVINSYSYTKPWGYDLMRPWVKANLPTDVTVAVHPFDAVNLGLKNPKTEFEVAGAFSLNEHKDNKASYLMLDLNWVGSPFYYWMFFGFDEAGLFWQKPVDIMRNTYHGIATEEFFRYQLHAVTKPWQAPDTHILAIKFFDWPSGENKIIKEFNFDNSDEGWSEYGMYKSGASFVHDKEIGRKTKGSLEFLPGGSRFPTARITSSPLEVKAGHLYEIEGYLKTNSILETREREGFLRIDFYEDTNNLEKVGKNASVSSRVYGVGDWVNKTVKEIAPPGVKYMTISFQTYVNTRTKIWLDDVVVRESVEKVVDPRDSAPYIKNEIDLNYVYPNSHGNL